MAEDSRMMDMIRAQRGAPAPEAATPAAPMGETPPSAAPMTTDEPKLGNREAAMVNLGIATDLIEQSLPALGAESPEGQKALAALRTLSGLIAPRKAKTGELQQAEILQMLQALPQAGGGSPEQRAIMGAGPAGAGAAPPMGAAPPGMTPPPAPM